MQNWEVIKKRISEMSKEEFIMFVNCANNSNIHYYADLCDAKKECYKIDCNTRCGDCVIDLLEEEYQPPKQEK